MNFNDVVNNGRTPVDSTQWLLSELNQTRDLNKVYDYRLIQPGKFYYFIVTEGESTLKLRERGVEDVKKDVNKKAGVAAQDFIEVNNSKMNSNYMGFLLKNNTRSMLIYNRAMCPYKAAKDFLAEYLGEITNNEFKNDIFDFYIKATVYKLDYSIRAISVSDIKGVYDIPLDELGSVFNLDDRILTGMDQMALQRIQAAQSGYVLQNGTYQFSQNLAIEQKAKRLLRAKVHTACVGEMFSKIELGGLAKIIG